MSIKKFFKANYIKKGSITLFLLFFMAILIAFPKKYIESCHQGLLLFAIVVLPSLLPFFFLTTLLTKTGVLFKICKPLSKISQTLFNLNGIAFYCYFMSILSGYPVGSKIISELYSKNAINDGEASRLAVLCSTSGPLFTIGAVGIAMFESKTCGFIIYVSHILSAFITALFFKNYGKPFGSLSLMQNGKKGENLLYETMYSTTISCVIVGGFISIFYVFADIFSDFNLLIFIQKPLALTLSSLSDGNLLANAFTYGLIECTRGCKNLSLLGANCFTVALATSLISFGGISIIMQSVVFLKSAKVKIWAFLLGKVLQMAISFILSFALMLVFSP